MALTSKWYGKAFISAFGAAGLNLAGGTVKALLTTSTYTPDQDAHDFLDDVTNELSGGGYARVTLSGKAVTYDGATNKLKFTSDAFTFAGLTGTFRSCVLFLDTGTASTSPLILAITSDADISASGQDVTVTPAGGGLADVTVS
jgi:hypothetical protein